MKRVSIKKLVLGGIILCFCIYIKGMEEPGVLEKIYNAYLSYFTPASEKQKEEINFQGAVDSMNSFIRGEISDIKSKMYPLTKTTYEGFVLTEWFNIDEAEDRFQELIQKIRELVSKANNEELMNAIAIFKNLINELNELQDSFAYAQSLIAENDQALYLQIEDSFRHLDQFNIDRMKVYEALGFSSKDRYGYTIEEIRAKADQLNKQLEKESPESKQIRQVKFTIGNEVGKNLYDAWYTDKKNGTTESGALSMMRIDPQNLDFIQVVSLITKIKMEKAELEELTKGLERVLKNLETEKTLAVG